MKVYFDNGKAVGMVKKRDCKICRFSSNEIWKNIGFLFQLPPSVLLVRCCGRRKRHKL